VQGGHEAWRYTLMSGVIPAIPLIVIRPFLPESPTWHEKKLAGTLRRPSFAELFHPSFRRTTIVTVVMMAAAYVAAFGAIQQTPRIVPGLAEVRTLPRPAQEQIVSGVQSFQEFGGLMGRILLAYLPPEHRAQLLSGRLPRFTPRTLTDRGRIERECAMVRRRGHAMSRAERTPGSVAIAVPLRMPASDTTYALAIFAPEVRFRSGDRAKWLQALRDCAAAVSSGRPLGSRGASVA